MFHPEYRYNIPYTRVPSGFCSCSFFFKYNYVVQKWTRGTCLFFRYQIDFFFNNFMRLNMVNHLLWHITACFTSIFYDGCEKGCTFCQKLHLLLPPKKGDKWRLNVIRISFFFFCRLELLTKKCPLEFLMKTTFSVSVETTL